MRPSAPLPVVGCARGEGSPPGRAADRPSLVWPGHTRPSARAARPRPRRARAAAGTPTSGAGATARRCAASSREAGLARPGRRRARTARRSRGSAVGSTSGAPGAAHQDQLGRERADPGQLAQLARAPPAARRRAGGAGVEAAVDAARASSRSHSTFTSGRPGTGVEVDQAAGPGKAASARPATSTSPWRPSASRSRRRGAHAHARALA